MMYRRITRQQARAAIGHWPRKRPFRLIKKCEAYVRTMTKKYPEIPESVWWSEVYDALQEAIHMRRAEG